MAKQHERAYDVPLPFVSFVGRISTKYYLDGSERMSILCNKSAANTSIYMHEASRAVQRNKNKNRQHCILHCLLPAVTQTKLSYLHPSDVCVRMDKFRLE